MIKEFRFLENTEKKLSVHYSTDRPKITKWVDGRFVMKNTKIYATNGTLKLQNYTGF